MKAEFITELKSLDVSEGFKTREYEVQELFLARSAELGFVLGVDAGFRYDGESIPDWLHWLVPPFGQSRRAAAIHDKGYRDAGFFRYEENDHGGWDRCEFIPLPREKIDKVYLEFALLKGTPEWRASLRYTVLRLVGWAAWRANRKEGK